MMWLRCGGWTFSGSSQTIVCRSCLEAMSSDIIRVISSGVHLNAMHIPQSVKYVHIRYMHGECS